MAVALARVPTRRERKLDYGHGGSERPNGKEWKTDFGRVASSSNGRERKSDYGRGPSPSPNGRERNSDYGCGNSSSPRRELLRPDPVSGSSPTERRSPGYDHGGSPISRTEMVTTDDYRLEASPDSKPELRDSPGYSGGESRIPDRYQRHVLAFIY